MDARMGRNGIDVRMGRNVCGIGSGLRCGIKYNKDKNKCVSIHTVWINRME